MKIPNDKELITISNPYIPTRECLPILSWLKENLPEGVEIEDVVIFETYHSSGGYDPEGRDSYSTLHFGHFISKEVFRQKEIENKIQKEKQRASDLQKQLKESQEKIDRLNGIRTNIKE